MYASSQIKPTVWGVLASLMLTTTTAPSLVFVILTALDYLPWPLRGTRLTFSIQYKTDEVIFSIHHVGQFDDSTSFLVQFQLISHSRLINQSRVRRGHPLGPRICRQPQRAPNPIRTRHTQPTHSAIFYRPGLPGALRDHLSVCLAGPPPKCPPPKVAPPTTHSLSPHPRRATSNHVVGVGDLRHMLEILDRSFNQSSHSTTGWATR